MLLPVTITLVTVLIYTVAMALLLFGLTRLKSSEPDKSIQVEKVTVVIPFRNEAEHLPGLLEELFRQSCPATQYCVILVNDHSEDGSGNMVSTGIEGRPGFSCLDLPYGKEGKKEAIAFAISRVQTSWIIQLDADCSIDPGYIEAHVSFLENNPSDLVAGFVTTRSGKDSFLEAFERLDLLGLAGAGAGSFYYRRPLMCSGANLLYSKSLFMEARKYDPADKTPSGDDMFLLIGARKLNKRVAFNPGRNAMVRTGNIPDGGKLIRQRIRWGAKSVLYRKGDIQLMAILVALTHLMILISPAWMALFPGSLSWFLPAIGLKTCMDFLILHATAGYTGQRGSLRWFFPVSVLYYPYMAVVITGSLLGRYSWKERDF
jgi:biofilm PGA synthesis N-glycosyltransferase PgaC